MDISAVCQRQLRHQAFKDALIKLKANGVEIDMPNKIPALIATFIAVILIASEQVVDRYVLEEPSSATDDNARF